MKPSNKKSKQTTNRWKCEDCGFSTDSYYEFQDHLASMSNVCWACNSYDDCLDLSKKYLEESKTEKDSNLAQLDAEISELNCSHPKDMANFT